MQGFNTIVNSLSFFMQSVFNNIGMGKEAFPWVANTTGLVYGLFYGIMSFFK